MNTTSSIDPLSFQMPLVLAVACLRHNRNSGSLPPITLPRGSRLWSHGRCSRARYGPARRCAALRTSSSLVPATHAKICSARSQTHKRAEGDSEIQRFVIQTPKREFSRGLLRTERFRVERDPAASTHQVARPASRRRSAGAQRHLLGVARRGPLGGSPRALRAA